MKFSFQRSRIGVLLWAAFPIAVFAQANSADASWNRLQAQTDARQPSVAASDWSGIGREAENFARDYPADARARSARGIALAAQIRAQAESAEWSPNLTAAIDAYVADTGNRVRDRLRLRIDSEFAKLRNKLGKDDKATRTAKISLARGLIHEFPGEPDGYGLLLVSAKVAGPDTAHALAQELLDSAAPEKFKEAARRVHAHADMLYQPLNLPEAVLPQTAAQSKVVVLYSWTAADEGFLRIIRRHAQASGIVFVGVSLDANGASAKSVASSLPGTQYFDGAGLDGPMAKRLNLLVTTSLYVVDRQGVVREVNGCENPEAAILGAIAMGGAQ